MLGRAVGDRCFKTHGRIADIVGERQDELAAGVVGEEVGDGVLGAGVEAGGLHGLDGLGGLSGAEGERGKRGGDDDGLDRVHGWLLLRLPDCPALI